MTDMSKAINGDCPRCGDQTSILSSGFAYCDGCGWQSQKPELVMNQRAGDPQAAYQAGLQNMPYEPSTAEERAAYQAGLQNMPW